MATSTKELTLERLAARALGVLNLEQTERFVARFDAVKTAASAMDEMDLMQLLELAANVSADCIKNKQVSLEIDDDKMDEGVLDYKLRGNTEYLMIVADEMASRGTNPLEQEPQFHLVTAYITAAQMVADELGGERAQPVLKKGEKLADMPFGSAERAKATRDFLKELLEYLDSVV
jgi:hypothetical protein